MPARPSKNVVQKVIEFPPEMAAEVESFAKGRQETFKAVVLAALRRHMDNPPPVEPPPPPPIYPPLPPVTSPVAPPEPPAPRKGKGKKA